MGYAVPIYKGQRKSENNKCKPHSNIVLDSDTDTAIHIGIWTACKIILSRCRKGLKLLNIGSAFLLAYGSSIIRSDITTYIANFSPLFIKPQSVICSDTTTYIANIYALFITPQVTSA